MGLAGFENTYFVLMVSYAHAKGDSAKRAAFEARCALARAHKVHALGIEEFDYFKSWKNPVLRELAPHMPGAKPLEMAHACKPAITATEVSETLDFLVKMNLLKKDRNGNYRQTEKSVSMGIVDAVPIAAREMQRQMAAALGEDPEDVLSGEKAPEVATEAPMPAISTTVTNDTEMLDLPPPTPTVPGANGDQPNTEMPPAPQEITDCSSSIIIIL